MAIIPQGRLFGWQEIENLGDLQRLALVIRTMPDEGLMRALERERGKGRDDYRVRCGQGDFGRVVRISRSVDRRVFTPRARPSYGWERLYKKRTSVERVNSRLDVSFGFERPLHPGRGEDAGEVFSCVVRDAGAGVGAGAGEAAREDAQPGVGLRGTGVSACNLPAARRRQGA